MKIILVSHVKEYAEATKEYILKMVANSNKKQILTAAGDTSGGVGTDFQKILTEIEKDKEDTLIICDLGSAVLSSVAASEMTSNKVHISTGSFTEGAFAAATLMFAGAKFKDAITAAEELMPKLI